MKTQKLEQILNQTRKSIHNYAGDNTDKWFYANRFVFARLQLDERKTKTKIKKELYRRNPYCYYANCKNKKLESIKGIHLHRIDKSKGYNLNNCILVHLQCHNKIHKDYQNIAPIRDTTILSKKSKKYHNNSFLYWWDITPKLAESLSPHTIIEFIKSDCAESCFVPFQELKSYLSKKRQTSRGEGNWGIKVLPRHPNELSVEEPRINQEKWIRISIKWEKNNNRNV